MQGGDDTNDNVNRADFERLLQQLGRLESHCTSELGLMRRDHDRLDTDIGKAKQECFARVDARFGELQIKQRELELGLVGMPGDSSKPGLVLRLDRIEQKFSTINWILGGGGILNAAAVIYALAKASGKV